MGSPAGNQKLIVKTAVTPATRYGERDSALVMTKPPKRLGDALSAKREAVDDGHYFSNLLDIFQG